jgi:hypothetical protein
MAVVDRTSSISDQEFERLASIERPSTPVAWAMPPRVLLAILSAAAGVIHLVMVPSHAGEWLPEGIAFSVVGWLQLALAVMVVVRPSRAVLRVLCVANLVFIATWVVARVWGLPVGPDAFVAHKPAFVDVTCVALEAAAVILAYELLAHPTLGSRWSKSSLVVFSVVPVAVLALVTAAIASPSAQGHGLSDAEGASHDGHGSTEAAADGHHQGAVLDGEDDKGLSLLMNGQGEGGGHAHDNSVAELDETTQRQLDTQLAKTTELISLYPTVAAAEAAGYYRQGPFSPGLGAHYSGGPGLGDVGGGPRIGTNPLMTPQALANPTLIYDGIEPDSKLAGFMYMIFSTDTENPPEGFAGPNDQWHYHTNVCIVPRPEGGVDAPLGADTSAPKELCDKYPGGTLIANTGYMVHVWTVPGYESPQGVFSNVNAQIDCPNGTYYVIPLEEIGTRSNVCQDVPA